MSDPRDFERPGLRGLDDRTPDAYDSARSSNAMWGWIAGAVFLVIVMALVFGPTGTSDQQTAGANPPANSINVAPPVTGAPITRTPPPAAAQAPAPAPSTTTGQGGTAQ